MNFASQKSNKINLYKKEHLFYTVAKSPKSPVILGFVRLICFSDVKKKRVKMLQRNYKTGKKHLNLI